jgi:hypothetical protein
MDKKFKYVSLFGKHENKTLIMKSTEPKMVVKTNAVFFHAGHKIHQNKWFKNPYYNTHTVRVAIICVK